MAKSTKCPSCRARIVLAKDVADGALLRCKTCRFEFRLGESKQAQALRVAERGGRALPRGPRIDPYKPKREFPVWAIVVGAVGVVALLAVVILVSVVDTTPLKPEPIARRSEPIEPPPPPDEGPTQPSNASDPPDKPDRPRPRPRPAVLRAQPLLPTGPWQRFMATVLDRQVALPGVQVDATDLQIGPQYAQSLLEAREAQDSPYPAPLQIQKIPWMLRSPVDPPIAEADANWVSEPIVLPAARNEIDQVLMSQDLPLAAVVYHSGGSMGRWAEVRNLRTGSSGGRMALPAGWHVAGVAGPDRILTLDAIDQGGICLWNAGQGGERIVRIPRPKPSRETEPLRIDWAGVCQRGQAVVFLSSGRLFVYPLATRETPWVLGGVNEPPAVSPGGELLAVVTGNGLYLIEIQSRRIVRCLAQPDLGDPWMPGGRKGLRSAMAFSADGRYLARMRVDGALQWWHFMTGRDGTVEFHEFAPGPGLDDLCLLPGGWVLIEGRLVHLRTRRTAWVYDLPESPGRASSGPALALAGPDGRCWFAAPGSQGVLCAVALPLPADREILNRWVAGPTALSPSAAVSVQIESPVGASELEAVARRKLDAAGLGFSPAATARLRLVVSPRGSGLPVAGTSGLDRVHAMRWFVRVELFQRQERIWHQPWKLVVDETDLTASQVPPAGNLRGALDDRARREVLASLEELTLPTLVSQSGRAARARTILGTYMTAPPD